MEWFIFIGVALLIIFISKVPKENWTKFPQKEEVSIESITRQIREHEKQLYEQYYEQYKDIPIYELELEIEWAKPDDIDDCDSEEKVKYEVLLDLLEEKQSE